MSKIDVHELSSKICDFMDDYDPYEFRDNYNSKEEAINDIENHLFDAFQTRQYIYSLNEISKDLKDDNDLQVLGLFERSKDILKDLRDYQKNFDKDIEL